MDTMSENGKEVTVDPKDGAEVTVTLPVPDGYNISRLGGYYIDANGYANALTGTLSGDSKQYSMVSGKLGIFAVAQKKVTGGNGTVVPGGSKNTGTTTVSSGTRTAASTAKATTTAAKTVKTGDETRVMLYVMLAVLALTMAAGAAVLGFSVKKKGTEK